MPDHDVDAATSTRSLGQRGLAFDSKDIFMRLFSFFAAAVAAAGVTAVACSGSSTPDTGTAAAATQWCTGNGSEVTGGPPSYHCSAEYVTCDNDTTLRVDCPVLGDGGTPPCKCSTNGADGPTFDRADTCDQIAKGNYDVGTSRFQAACGWAAYDLSKRVAPK